MVFCLMFSTVAFAAENERTDAAMEDDYVTYAPAPAIPFIQFRVYAVYSADHPEGEFIQPSQLATALNHGGSWLRVVTYEHGYTGTWTATVKNSPMKLEDTQGVDLDGDRIIDGYLCTWLYTGEFSSGYFSASIKSANAPWNTMYFSNLIFVK